MTKILVLISAVIYFTACTVKTTEKLTDVRHPYGVFIGAEKEKLLSLNNYDVLVIDAELLTAENIDVIHQNGNNEIYSYLNIGSVEDFRSYYEEFLPFTIGEYEDWDNEKWIDVSSEKWQTHIVEAADELVDKGVSGLFVDNTDVYYVFHEQKIYNALLDIFNAFTEKGIKVIVNGGDVFISEVINNCSIPTCINAVNQETVFTSINFDDKSFGENNWENREYFIEYLNVCKQIGMDVLLIEYGANDKLREKVMYYCNENDYVCYFADSLAVVCHAKRKKLTSKIQKNPPEKKLPGGFKTYLNGFIMPF